MGMTNLGGSKTIPGNISFKKKRILKKIWLRHLTVR